VQVVGFFDVAAAAGDGPITALVGGASCSIRSALQHRVHLMATKTVSQYRLLTTALSHNVHDSRRSGFQLHRGSSPLLLSTVSVH